MAMLGYTKTDLTWEQINALTFDGIAAITACLATSGAGRNLGVHYRAGKITALNDEGSERHFQIQVSSTGKVKIEDYGKTNEQRDRDEKAAWDTINPFARAVVMKHWPDLLLINRIALAKAAAGEAGYDLSLAAILGGKARAKFQELFPEVKTLDEAKCCLRGLAEREWVGEAMKG